MTSSLSVRPARRDRPDPRGWRAPLGWIALASACATLGAGCGPQGPRDVLLIMVDTLRVDRLGAYGSQRGLTPFLAASARFRSGQPRGLLRPEKAVGPRQLQAIEGLYDAEVASLDAELSALFAELESRGLLANTLVIVTADHGEEFQEHGGIGHAHSLHEELIRVPLLVHLPGQTRRVDVREVVSLVDVAPTILAWVGAPAPATFEGRSLGHRLAAAGWSGTDSGETPARAAFSELPSPPVRPLPGHLRAVVTSTGKLIGGNAGERSFYALRGAQREPDGGGLAAAERALLEDELTRFEERLSRTGGHRLERPLDPAALTRLRALGYLQDSDE